VPEVRLTRTIDFSTSLRCVNPALSPEENHRLFGARAAQHGHNYQLSVTLRGEPDPVTGMVMDVKDLQAILDREIMARFDHRDLNLDTPYFEKEPPTPENFLLLIRRLLVAALPPGSLDHLRLQEDPETFVEWLEPAEGKP
jgi:6-pyruvoyltetrahydropterin/6-carboxytetrahydropterin synthase